MVMRHWKKLVGRMAVTALLAAGVAAAEEAPHPGVTSMKEAMELSAQRKVPIVVDFSAEW